MNEYVQDNPYAAPAAAVVDAAAPEQVLADRGVRLAAVLLDSLFVGLAVWIWRAPSSRWERG